MSTEADSHSQVVTGVGGTVAATVTTIGAITLPANGPWKIFGIWGYVVQGTVIAAQATMGHIQMVSVSGDVTPNPAPSAWPLAATASFLGAATGRPQVPVTINPCTLEASGKAIVNMNYVNDCAVTTGSDVALGVLYGKTVPTRVSPAFSDFVTAGFNTAGANAVGVITLAEKAKRIVAIGCDVIQNLVSTTGEEILPYWTITSDDIDFPPSQWPCNSAASEGLVTNHGYNNPIVPSMIPVNIPVVGGARLNISVTLLAGTTNNVQGTAYIMYE